jgi:hypothetical protein
MKRMGMCGVLLVCAAFGLSAQGFYLDAGLGIGKGWTKLKNGEGVFKTSDYEELDQIAVDVGLKAGYGPFGGAPVYVVGEIAGMGHRIYEDSNYVQFNSYLIGPGVIFYPIPQMQFASSIGLSFTIFDSSEPIEMPENKSGFAWNISGAFDLGRGNHGCLIGVRYFYTENTFKDSKLKQESSMVGVFVKYAFRRKVPTGY